MFVNANVGGGGRGPHDDFWYYPVGVTAGGGVRVNANTALAVPTFYACALVLGQDLGKLPFHLYRREGRGRELATEHPLYRIIHRQPNRWQTAFQWRQMMQWHLVLRYNAYSEKLFDRRGHVTDLVPLHPDRVKVERFIGADGVVNFRYQVKDLQGGNERTLVRGEMFHVRGLTSDGIEGFSPLEAQADSIAEGLAAQRYSKKTLENDARPGGVLEWEGNFKSDEDREAFRKSWHAAQGGMNRGKTAVLERGMKWTEIGVSNTDLQLIDLRKLKAYDVAAIHRMPPHKVGLLDKATFSNIEHQAIEYATDTVHPWCENWEQELGMQLLLPEEQDEFYFKANLNALQRGDAKTRAEFYTRLFQAGALSPNDIRDYEDENPVDGGDRRFVPVNLVPLDRVDDVVDRGGNRDAGPGNGGDQGGREGKAGGGAHASRADAIERAAAERVVRKEAAALRKLNGGGNGEQWIARCEEFYRGHISFVEDVLQVDADTAMAYCERRVAFAQAALERNELLDVFFGDLDTSGVDDLLGFIKRASAA